MAEVQHIIAESAVRSPLTDAVSTPAICRVQHLGSVRYAEAFACQQDLVLRRKADEIPDQLLFVEHPHVVTMGRSAHSENILASPELLERAGIELHHSDRGGDVTYHGPGQLIGYPIVDLRKWKRDVVAYVRGLEQVLIDLEDPRDTPRLRRVLWINTPH